MVWSITFHTKKRIQQIYSKKKKMEKKKEPLKYNLKERNFQSLKKLLVLTVTRNCNVLEGIYTF